MKNRRRSPKNVHARILRKNLHYRDYYYNVYLCTVISFHNINTYVSFLITKTKNAATIQQLRSVCLNNENGCAINSNFISTGNVNRAGRVLRKSVRVLNRRTQTHARNATAVDVNTSARMHVCLCVCVVCMCI